MITAGLLAAFGVVDIFWAIVIGTSLVVVGDLAVFVVGHGLARHLHTHPRLRRLMRTRTMARARHLYVHRGPWTLSIARLIPGLKTPFVLTAGMLRMSWPKFLLFDMVSAVLIAPAIVLAAYYSSISLAQFESTVRDAAPTAIPVFLLLLAGLVLAWHFRRRRHQRRRAGRLRLAMELAMIAAGRAPAPDPMTAAPCAAEPAEADAPSAA
ncbi:MAG: VTT domain-containing protein [Acidobacteria bacterium]|nr:VTT domain-containing protein [Acidobacteriota bacterium]